MENTLKDSFGRKIDYLRLSVTDRCNLRCTYCMPEGGIKLAGRDELLTYEEIIKITGILAGLGISKVRLTGGEPLLRDNILDLISGLSPLDGIEKISITTNGILLDRFLEGLKRRGISGLNISLDTLDADKYRKITRGGDIGRVISVIRKAMDMGFGSIKINSVMGDFLNIGDIERFVDWSVREKIDIRFIEMMQVAPLDGIECSSKNISKKADTRSLTTDDIFKVMQRFGEIEDLKSKKGHGPAVYYRLKGARGSIGFIRNREETCYYCNRVRITPLGILRLCLFSGEGLDIRERIRSRVSEKVIKDDIIRFIKRKPKNRNSSGIECSPEDKKMIPDLMNRIGG